MTKADKEKINKVFEKVEARLKQLENELARVRVTLVAYLEESEIDAGKPSFALDSWRMDQALKDADMRLQDRKEKRKESVC